MDAEEKILIERLYNALKEAQDHLDFCGYGDSYERECAKSEHLEEHIETALTNYERFFIVR